MELFDEELNLANVIRVGGANELIVGQIEKFHGLAEFSAVEIGERLRVQPLVARRLLNFDAVLIGSRQKEHFIPGKTHGSCPSVTQGGGVHMPNVGPVVHVVNRGCDAA